MKTTLWSVAVGGTAVLVFAIAFGLNRPAPVWDRPAPPRARIRQRLQIPSLRYPANGAFAPLEVGRPGSCNFWFFNPNEDSVEVGLLKKSCKCTSVFLHHVPSETLVVCNASRIGAPAILSPGGVMACLSPALVDLALAEWQDLWPQPPLESGKPAIDLATDHHARVPPRALGYFRLVWKTERPERRSLDVSLWATDKEENVNLALEVRGEFLSPLMAEPEIYAGSLEESQLPRTLRLYCYSRTRKLLRPTARVLHDDRAPGADPVEVGPVVRADETSFRALESRLDLPTNSVQCVYEAPVTLRAVSADGTAHDQGVFSRYVEFSSGEEGEEPLLVTIKGRVTSPVTLEDVGENGQVHFETFPADRGADKTIRLHSNLSDLNLSIDNKRVPEFLGVPVLDAPDAAPSGGRTWRLHLRVLPGKVTGVFPDANSPIFRDSAIYLRLGENAPRSLRIPLSGVAKIK
jgi:hypothetical protein